MKKPVIVISSHVVRGSVGNRAAVFALETRGHPVWAVPTVILPYHPGHGPATRIVPDRNQFEGLLDDLANSRWLGELGGILTGYIADAAQAEAAGRFVTRLKAKNPDAIHLCDPVMGDDGGLYVHEDTAAAIRTHLAGRADILTPNRFELEWLSGESISGVNEARRAAANLAPATVLATSIPAMMRGNIANLLVHGSEAMLAEHMMDALGQIEGLRLLGETAERAPVFSFVVEGAHAHDLAMILDQDGIAVRSGHHCAHPLLQQLGVSATLRASLGIYNTIEEIDHFAQSLERARRMLVG